MNSFKQMSIVALTLASLAAPAAAQGISIGPDGVRVLDARESRGDDRRGGGREISEREAVRVAKGEGLRDVEDVRRTKSSFRVEGTDRRGDDIEVVVDRRSGDVISVQ